jgi:radial spoke head protein 4A
MSSQKGLKQKLESVESDQHNLYQHLTDVLRQMLIDNPTNAYDLFEEYSLQVRNKRAGKGEPEK